MIKSFKLLYVIIAVLLISSNSQAQIQSSVIQLFFKTSRMTWDETNQIWIPTPTQEIKIGNCIGCSYAIDTSLLSYTRVGLEYYEAQGPPWSQSIDVRIMDSPNYPVRAGDNGISHDFRGFFNDTQVDSFYIEVRDLEVADDNNMTIKWPISSELTERCDSMFLINLMDPFAYPDPSNDIKINMFEADSIVIPQYGSPETPQMTYMIIKHGVKLIDTIETLAGDVKLEGTNIPGQFNLYSNYPNPFNPSTTIRFDMQKRAVADISVYNALGQKVITLVSEEIQPGTYSTTWNGTNSHGQAMGSGVYYVRMLTWSLDGKGQDFSDLKKLILLK